MSSPATPSPRPPLERVTVLSGGVGGARFVRGLLHLLRTAHQSTHEPPAGPEVTVIANTGDDLWLHGLKICPDLDTVMYTLGGGIDPERGWGRDGETWSVKDELAAYAVGPDWFGLGDRDLATHLVRTQMLEAGYSLSDVTAAMCRRWKPGVRLLPMSDDRVETHVLIEDPSDGERRAVHFQEYWVRHRAEVPAYAVTAIGADRATPAPGVLEAIAEADVVIVPPSNPVVSIGTILSVPGIRDAVRATPAPVVGISGIIGGDHVHGMARQLLEVIGVECSAGAVAAHYGARSSDGILDAWLVDTLDEPGVAETESLGVRSRAVPLLMRDDTATAAIAAAALSLAGIGEPVPR